MFLVTFFDGGASISTVMCLFLFPSTDDDRFAIRLKLEENISLRTCEFTSLRNFVISYAGGGSPQLLVIEAILFQGILISPVFFYETNFGTSPRNEGNRGWANLMKKLFTPWDTKLSGPDASPPMGHEETKLITISMDHERTGSCRANYSTFVAPCNSIGRETGNQFRLAISLTAASVLLRRIEDVLANRRAGFLT